MSRFIKSLFEKKKDLKYGKGHRLNEDTKSSFQHHQYQQKQEISTSSKPVEYSEASRLAGEAALARMEQSNNYFIN